MSGFIGVLQEFISILVGGIGSMAEGIGSGANQFVTDLFLTTGTDGTVNGLSPFGGVVAIFGGIALSVGLGRLIFRWVRTIGK